MKSSRAAAGAGQYPSHDEPVGPAELRRNLAKYLRRAAAGRTVTIRARGGDAYVLRRAEPDGLVSIFGCMRDRTKLGDGVVVNASEIWHPGDLP